MAANYMHKMENKSLWKDEVSYGDDTWYMGRTFEELKYYVCVTLLIFLLHAMEFSKVLYVRVIFQLFKCTIHIPSTTTTIALFIFP